MWAATGALVALAFAGAFAAAFAGAFVAALGDDGDDALAAAAAAAAAADALVILLGEGDRGDFLRAAELNILTSIITSIKNIKK